ncbi:RING-H2 finger protein ATL39 [Panicum miliaceum]|uniref:RING-type E3 ubiquitin transferase n=1 Tax=Panicum miliaceum TaxID=4540 RepID=A0A3L6STC8_PANMI|nr:RING-H2 finger protein ATL39 [Panicum miliaceum]
MSMSSPNSWLFSDSSRYSTRARLLFMGLSFAIGILTFLLYLAIWYICSSRRRRSRQQRGTGAAADVEAADGGDRGMSADAIAALPTFTFARDEDGRGPAAVLDCPVCLGQVQAGEKVRRLPKCAHAFHAECVDAWLRAHSTCPMCRAAVVGPAAAAAATKHAAAPAPAEALPPV